MLIPRLVESRRAMYQAKEAREEIRRIRTAVEDMRGESRSTQLTAARRLRYAPKIQEWGAEENPGIRLDKMPNISMEGRVRWTISRLERAERRLAILEMGAATFSRRMGAIALKANDKLDDSLPMPVETGEVHQKTERNDSVWDKINHAIAEIKSYVVQAVLELANTPTNQTPGPSGARRTEWNRKGHSDAA